MPHGPTIQDIREEIQRAGINAGELRTSEFDGGFWGGAGVIITDAPPAPTPPGFYPDPLFVVTEHAAALTWLFIRLRECFAQFDEYGLAKEEWFEAFAARANDFLAAHQAPAAADLLLDVLAGAGEIHDEVAAHGWNAEMVRIHPQK